MTFITVSVLIFLSIVVSVYLIVVTIERCRNEKRINFIYCLAGIFFYSLGYFIEMTGGDTGSGIVAVKLMYIGSCFMPPFFFFFVADYCELKIKKHFYKIPMLIIAVLNYALIATFDHHPLIYSAYHYNSTQTLPGIQIQPGPLYPVTTVFSFLCILLTCGFLIKELRGTKGVRRNALVMLLVASLAPVFAQLLYILLLFVFPAGPLTGINFTAFVLVISNAILYFTILKNDLFDLAPKAYSITVDLIRDAFVVLDNKMNYISSNRNARQLFPDLENFPKGKDIRDFEYWPKELAEAGDQNTNPGDAGVENNFTLPQRQGRNYSGWMNAVSGEDKKTAGWVVLIQDITETVNLINNIQAQRDQISAMQDNLKEGLFLMDRNCVIQPSYSRALENVLSCKNIQGKDFVDLLGKSFDPKDLETIRDYFNMLFDGQMETETLEDLNPLKEFSYTSIETNKNKTLQGLFVTVDQGKGDMLILGTFQDITAEVELKKQLEEEESRRRDEMQTIFELIQVNPRVFNDFIEDADYEFNRINETLKEKKTSAHDAVVSIYQSIHAIKSNALVVGLVSFGEKLHHLETTLKELREKDQIGFDDLLHITLELNKRMQDKEKFLDIINRLKNFTAGKDADMKSEREVFMETLSGTCGKAAQYFGKKARLSVTALDEEVITGEQRRAVKEILTQLVRNSVCHGIESPEDRVKKGKEETGGISVSARLEDGGIHIILKDDGQGLNFKKIAERAFEMGLVKNEEDKANKQLLSKVIFMPGFSTSQTESMHAGRGIGLSLVSDRLRELHGTIRIQSAADNGTSFDIRIPAQ
ncbi:MAG: ATP-binding protein [Treponema sp.]|jgi:two-component system chemotaxis sensor kinase CheA|nr:ATP-binding protein [Treponema sp.]